MKKFFMGISLMLAAITTSMQSMNIQGGPHYTITNKTSEQLRIEGFNTNNPTDLYFSELLEPGETKGYLGGTHYPNFAFKIIHKKSVLKTPELPYQDTGVMIQSSGGKISFSVNIK